MRATDSRGRGTLDLSKALDALLTDLRFPFWISRHLHAGRQAMRRKLQDQCEPRLRGTLNEVHLSLILLRLPRCGILAAQSCEDLIDVHCRMVQIQSIP